MKKNQKNVKIIFCDHGIIKKHDTSVLYAFIKTIQKKK